MPTSVLIYLIDLANIIRGGEYEGEQGMSYYYDFLKEYVEKRLFKE